VSFLISLAVDCILLVHCAHKLLDSLSLNLKPRKIIVCCCAF